MRLTIESTDELGCIELEDGAEVPCRIWKGTTEAGTFCLLFVTRIAVPVDVDPAEFAELAAPPELIATLPEALRELADKVEAYFIGASQ